MMPNYKEDTRIVQYWLNLRTVGAISQAVREASDLLRTLPGMTDPETVYICQDTSGVANEVSLFLRENTMTDGSIAYDLQIV